MGLPVVTVAAGGLPIVESTVGGTPVTEATNGYGVAVTKVISPALGLPVVFETIGVAPGTPVLTTFATFNGTPSAGVVLSNGNRTVVHGTTGNGSGVSSLTTLGAGKYYFEVTVSVWGASASNANGIGIGNYYTGTFAEFLGTFANGVGVSLGAGSSNIYSQGTNTTKDVGIISAGDIIGAAIDMTAKLAWFRRNNGIWNASGAANPATGVGGVAFTTTPVAPFVRFTNGPATDAFIGNFGQAAFANAAPSGFALGWGT